MSCLLSIDQSITSCGYSVFNIDKNDFNLIHYDTIKLDTKLDFFQRIISLEGILDQLVKDFNIYAAVFEDIQKNKGTGLTTYKKLSSLLFFLQYYFFYKEINYQVIHVNTWRSDYKKINNLSKVNKEIVFLHLFEMLGKPRSFDNHMSDSIGMGLSHCYRNLSLNKGEIGKTKFILK